MNEKDFNLSQRRLQSEAWRPCTYSKPLSDSEQMRIDRQMFDLFVQRSVEQRPEVNQPVEEQAYFTPDDARSLIDEVVPRLDKGYGWFASSQPAILARLLNEIEVFRQNHIAERGEPPSNSRIFLRYRSLLDAAQEGDNYPGEAVRLLDALMNGSIKNGTIGGVW